MKEFAEVIGLLLALSAVALGLYALLLWLGVSILV